MRLIEWRLLGCWCVIASLAALSAFANAGTATLTPIKDNTLIENPGGGASNALNEGIYSGRSGPLAGGARFRAVLAFDLSGIPQGTSITNASLNLTLLQFSTNFDQVHSLHRMLADWGEGTSNGAGGGGGEPTSGDATWLHTFYPNAFWKNQGGDFEPNPTASLVVPPKMGTYTWSSAQLIADVQDWVNNPLSNFGWAVLGNEVDYQTARKFASREYEIISARPELIVEFETAPPCDGDIAPSGGNGAVDVDDLLLVINSWGSCDDPENCPADIAPPGGNGVVNVDDLLLVINNWGPCD